MKRDPIDQLAAQLFEAARGERVPKGARRRALQAARAELGRNEPKDAPRGVPRKWLIASVGAAIAAGATLFLRPRAASVGIGAEPAVLVRTARERPNRPQSVEAPIEPMAAAFGAQVAPKVPLATAPVRSASASLSDELEALKVASGALSSGDVAAALAALDRYDRVLKGQKLRAEATLLRIEALSRTGQNETASALARRFVEQNPGSPLVDRARSFVRD